MVHGLAGSAAIVLLALDKLGSPLWGVAYVLLFGAGSIVGMALLSLVIANPLPSYEEVVNRSPVAIFLLAGLPIVALVYPLYSTLCIVLSLSALRHPMASERFMGDEARRRARPWLIAASPRRYSKPRPKASMSISTMSAATTSPPPSPAPT